MLPNPALRGQRQEQSLAWLAHQLIGLSKNDANVFDSIIVVTDRRILDKQIRDTIKQYAQVGATVGHAEHSGDLRKFIEAGKKIITICRRIWIAHRYIQPSRSTTSCNATSAGPNATSLIRFSTPAWLST